MADTAPLSLHRIAKSFGCFSHLFAFALYLLPPLGLSGSGLRPFLLGFEAGALPVPWPHACGLAPALVRLALLLLRSSPSLLLVFLEPQTYLRICRWGTSGFAPRTFFFLQLGTGAGSPLPPILSRVWTSSPSGVGFVPPPRRLELRSTRLLLLRGRRLGARPRPQSFRRFFWPSSTLRGRVGPALARSVTFASASVSRPFPLLVEVEGRDVVPGRSRGVPRDLLVTSQVFFSP